MAFITSLLLKSLRATDIWSWLYQFWLRWFLWRQLTANKTYQRHMSVHHPFDRITNVFQQVPAIGHLFGLRCPFTCCCGIDTAAITRDNLYFRVFSEPGSQRTLIATGKQDKGTASIKIDY